VLFGLSAPGSVKSYLFPPAFAFLSIPMRNLTQGTRQQIFPRLLLT